ncbi:MAG: hypothetical protein AAGF33_04985 [Pseudomonadota bacterium]
MRRVLTSWPVIILSAVAFLAIGYSFSIYAPQTGEPILDMIASRADVLARLDAMDADQKAVHFQMTLLPDTFYPIAYALLLAGLAMRAFPEAGWWLAIPAFAAGGIDIIENIVQLMALQGSVGLVGLKAVLTPAKFILFVCSALMVLVCWLLVGTKALRRRMKGT